MNVSPIILNSNYSLPILGALRYPGVRKAVTVERNR
jgi:hypothetical protein